MGATIVALQETVSAIRAAFRMRKAVMTYQEIADASGVNLASLARFNHGRDVSADVLRRIAVWLDAQEAKDIHHGTR